MVITPPLHHRLTDRNAEMKKTSNWREGDQRLAFACFFVKYLKMFYVQYILVLRMFEIIIAKEILIYSGVWENA